MKILMFFVLYFIITFNSFGFSEIVLNNTNSVSLNGPVEPSSVSRLMAELQQLDTQKLSKTPIYLVLNTPGGSILDGLQLIQFARSLNRPVHTITIFSGSMGFQITQNLGRRYITEFGEMMSHKARGSISGEFPGQLDARYKHILNIIENMDRTTIRRTQGKQTLESYRNLYENEYWASSEKAVKDGFADEIVKVKCDKSLNGFSEKEISFGPFVAKLRFSNCPIITIPVDVGGSSNFVEKERIKKMYSLMTRTIPASF